MKFGKQLQQVSFEFVVGAVDLVDQQDRRLRARRIDGLQQRALDEKRLAVQFAARLPSIERVGGLENAQLEELPRVVLLVHRVADVEALVALKADEIGPKHRGHCRSQRRLANARFALEEERPAQAKR